MSSRGNDAVLLALGLQLACGGADAQPPSDESSGSTSVEQSSSSSSTGDTRSDDTTTSGSSTGDPGIPTGESDGSSTDEDDNGSSGTTEPEPEPAPCPPYSGLGNVGSTIELRSTPAFEARNGASYVVHRETVAVELGTPTRVTIAVTTSYTAGDVHSDGIQTQHFTCDRQGARLHRWDVRNVGVSETVVTYDPPWLSTPWGVVEGSQWLQESTVTTVTTTADGEVTSTDEQSQTFTTARSTTIQTPLGALEVLVGTIHDPESGSTSTVYLHADYGFVGIETGLLEVVDANIVRW